MKPATESADAQVAQFPCDACGGALLFDPEGCVLRCRQCKRPGSAELLAGSGPGPRELRMDYGYALSERGLQLVTHNVTCQSCGATIALDPIERAGACIYCASPMVVAGGEAEPPITPESLVPFRVTRPQALDSYRRWIKRLWFRRGDLYRLARVELLNGVYVPYWTFDAIVDSHWTAERGWHYYETETYTEVENGVSVTKTRQVQRTRWEFASGQRRDAFDDVLVCASGAVDGDLVKRINSFNTTELVAYAPAYLSGWHAERYAMDLPPAHDAARASMARSQEARCAGDVGGNEQRSLSVTNEFSQESFKHILLPLYVLAYRYRDRPYKVLVSGQTGQVAGEAPWSFWKIFFAVLAAVLLIATVISWDRLVDWERSVVGTSELRSGRQ